MGPLYQKRVCKLEIWSSDINSLLCGEDSFCLKDEGIFLQENRQFFKDVVKKKLFVRFHKKVLEIS